MQVLAGDIGGTKTNLGLYGVSGPRKVELVREHSFRSRDYQGLEEIVERFLDAPSSRIAAAAFGVAGPVVDGPITLTNLPWSIDPASVARRIGCERIRLLNDLETTAYGALFLEAASLRVLNAGLERRTHRAVIAAGTGLGQAILFWDGERYRPAATEGGHAAFSPRDEREVGLLRFLQQEHGRVSWERVLSGPGLHAIYRYLVQEHGARVTSDVRERMQGEDPSAVIGEAGVRGACATCEEAVDMFVSLYGAQAANLALTTLALGGVYVGGGIVTKLLPKVEAGAFMESFKAVGRFGSLLAETPVWAILDPKTSLLGAAETALDLVR